MTHGIVEIGYIFILRVWCSVWGGVPRGVGTWFHMSEIRVQGLVWGIRPGICVEGGNTGASCVAWGTETGVVVVPFGKTEDHQFVIPVL